MIFAAASQSTNKKNKKVWEARLQEARQVVDDAAEALGKLEADRKVGWLHDVHQRSAVRLRDMCAKNRGVYIKLGQVLAQMDHMIPT